MLILGCGNSQDLNTIYVCLPKVKKCVMSDDCELFLLISMNEQNGNA